MSKTLSRRCFASSAGAAGMALWALPSPGLAQEPAERFVEVLSRQLLAIVTSDANEGERRQKFRTLLAANADIPRIAMFSLGRYARSLAENDRKTYFDLVARFIAHIFSTHALNLDISAEGSTITGSSKPSDRETIVSSDVKFANGRSMAVDWRVATGEGTLKVTDVGVNGIWLVFQQRTEFVSVIKNADGSLEALFAFLRETAR